MFNNQLKMNCKNGRVYGRAVLRQQGRFGVNGDRLADAAEPQIHVDGGDLGCTPGYLSVPSNPQSREGQSF